MVRKTQYRNAINDLLVESDRPVSTREVFEYLNDRFRWGVSMNITANLLSKNKNTENISPKCKSPGYSARQTTYWVIKNG
jgi:predicted Zn-ribbon and HTH transcriptional regulator